VRWIQTRVAKTALSRLEWVEEAMSTVLRDLYDARASRPAADHGMVRMPLQRHPSTVRFRSRRPKGSTRRRRQTRGSARRPAPPCVFARRRLKARSPRAQARRAEREDREAATKLRRRPRRGPRSGHPDRHSKDAAIRAASQGRPLAVRRRTRVDRLVTTLRGAPRGAAAPPLGSKCCRHGPCGEAI
jgi:hypothetical protein